MRSSDKKQLKYLHEAVGCCCTRIPPCKFCLARALGVMTEAEGDALLPQIIPSGVRFESVTVFRASRIRNAQGLVQ